MAIDPKQVEEMRATIKSPERYTALSPWTVEECRLLLAEVERLRDIERHARALIAVRAEYLRGKGPPGIIKQAVLEKRADDAADALGDALKG